MALGNMALENKNRDAIAQKLRDFSVDFKVEVKDCGVVVTAKSFELETPQLRYLANITAGCTITFGRSGANFRMIID